MVNAHFERIYKAIDELMDCGDTAYRIAEEAGVKKPIVYRIKKDRSLIRKLQIESAEKIFAYAEKRGY